MALIQSMVDVENGHTHFDWRMRTQGFEPGAIIFRASILSNYILSKYYNLGGGVVGGGNYTS